MFGSIEKTPFIISKSVCLERWIFVEIKKIEKWKNFDQQPIPDIKLQTRGALLFLWFSVWILLKLRVFLEADGFSRRLRDYPTHHNLDLFES